MPDIQLHDPQLDANEQTIETLETSSYWIKICPHLSVGKNAPISPAEVNVAHTDELRKQFADNGFIHLCNKNMDVSLDIVDALALGVVMLMKHGWPASFIFMFDEAWGVIERARLLVQEVSGGSHFIGDMYAWCVDPAVGQKGWGPHRDRMVSYTTNYSTW